MIVSVIICSHNSRLDYLQRVLDALRKQTLSLMQWELVVVDNASKELLQPRIDLSWHPNAFVVRNPLPEDQASLVGARIIGMENTSAANLVFVDDDNVLDSRYLEEAYWIAENQRHLGAWGGQIFLEYEDPSKKLPPELEGLLCFRSLTKAIWSNANEHYASTPWGAGLCIRREVADRYRQRLQSEPDRGRLDPVGREMRFGGDTDLVSAAMLLGMGKGVFPQLSLTHLIPTRRCDIQFLTRCLEAHGYSATLHGWLDTGNPPAPRSDVRFWVNEFLHWPLRNKWQRLRQSAFRRGAWRAHRELMGTTPRGFINKNPAPHGVEQL